MIRTNALSTTSHSQNQILRPPLQDRKLRINSRRNSKWLKNRKEGTAQTKKAGKTVQLVRRTEGIRILSSMIQLGQVLVDVRLKSNSNMKLMKPAEKYYAATEPLQLPCQPCHPALNLGACEINGTGSP